MLFATMGSRIFFLIILFFIQDVTSLQDDNDKTDLTEICPKILHRVFTQSAPAGDTKSGNFSQYKDVTDIKTCVKNCCLQKSNCNIAFIFEDICYHVKCLNNELCIPKKRKVKGQLQMVLVNPVVDYNSNPETSTLTWIDILKTSNIEELLPTTENDPEKLNFWKQQHKFRFNNDPTNYDEDQLPIVNEKRLNTLLSQKLNENNNGYDRFGSGQQFLSDDNIAQSLNDPSTYLGSTNLIACDLSSLEQICRFNEECIPIIPDSREGVCRCLDGYKRNKLGKCIKISDIDFAADTIVEKLFNDNNLERQSLAADLPAETTTKPPLKQIDVTVASRIVQLPEKEVTLEAFTVPDEQTSSDTYRYSWTLVTQPSGPVNGTITDQAKDKVKLSNLSEGLYTFKITVNGSGSYGETMVNVTVLPEKRINKIPEAIITPKEQTIKPPNSKAILDGSTSIDDDKIISWHWELIEGPIGYQPVLPDTSTLQLTDLQIPGNYTFKLTVTDSDNKQNSTTSNIIVQKITDYPPEANAGPDVILYLPHNNVTLNGTLSTDDREIVAWEWTNDSNKGGKAVDMQHTRTQYLQLSNLEEGFYTFVLKVTDASNQSSSAKVNVFVKPPSNLPPVANAGPNVGNVKYLWEYFSKFGEIDVIKMKKQYSNYRNDIYFSAYVNYKNPESAVHAIQNEKTQSNEMIVTYADSWKQPNQNVFTSEISKISHNDESFRLLTLNDYCLLHIYTFLSFKDQLNLSLLSERFEHIFCTYYRTKKLLNFEDDQIEGLTLMKIRNFLIEFGKYIEEYDRLSCYYETKNVRLLKLILNYCPNINSLKFSWTSFKNEKFSTKLAKYENMEILEIMNCRLSDADIEHLSNLNKVKILNLSGNNELTGIHMDKFTNLQLLNLDSCEDLTEGNFISMIKKLENLKLLNIQGCRNLRNLTFQYLTENCKNLEDLKISIYREDMRLIGIEIGKMKNLKHLTVLNSNPRGCTGYFSECDKLSEFLKAICQTELKNHLITFEMPLCKLKNSDYLHIGQFTKLKKLLFGIYSQEIPPNFLLILEFLKELEILCIRLESFYSLSPNFIMEVINFLREQTEKRKLLTMLIDISKIKYDQLEKTINLPQTWIVLNGSQSTDVIHIKSYFWVQIAGPNKAIIANANASIANATALTVGKYIFELTVTDENMNTGKDQTVVTVVQEKNFPPKADAGGEQTVKLPISAVYLNGSKSSDDLRIVKYLWTRDDSSLAYGNIVGQTDFEPILILTDLVPGRYSFTLTVYDNQGLSNSQSVSLVVNQDPIVMNLVELTLSLGITSLTKTEYDTIVQKIALIIGDVKVHIRELKVDSRSGEAILVFYVEKINTNGKLHIVPGVDIEKILKDKFFRDESLLGTPFTDARTTICQNKCSGHGTCDTITRACLCEAFWMPSIFYYWGVDDANCDWSVLYVVVGVFVGFLLLSGLFWGLSCVFRRRRTKKSRTRPKKLPQKYALLGTKEDELPSFTRGTSLTDSDTDSDVLFESRSKQNGILRLNGTNKNGPKYSKTRLGRKIRT